MGTWYANTRQIRTASTWLSVPTRNLERETNFERQLPENISNHILGHAILFAISYRVSAADFSGDHVDTWYRYQWATPDIRHGVLARGRLDRPSCRGAENGLGTERAD